MIVDVGTGDGRAVLDAARRDLAALVVGIDADAAAMRAASRAASRGGLPNALFVATGAELIPATAQGLADELLVTLPWGSLLAGAAGPEPWFTDLLRRLLRPGGVARLTLSLGDREDATGLARLDASSAAALAARYRAAAPTTCGCSDRPGRAGSASRSTGRHGASCSVP